MPWTHSGAHELRMNYEHTASTSYLAVGEETKLSDSQDTTTTTDQLSAGMPVSTAGLDHFTPPQSTNGGFHSGEQVSGDHVEQRQVSKDDAQVSS